MAIKISKAEFDALPEAVKAKFEADGDEYVLQEQDVEGLKKSKAEILEEKKRIQAERDELAKFKADKEAEAAEAELEKKKAEGDLESWKKAYDERAKKELETERAEKLALFTDVKRERLTNELIKRGVLPDRANYLVGEMDAEIELAKDDNGKYTIKKKGGIGDAAEFDAMINEAKQAKPFFFAANGASGSGASGSQQASGNGRTISRKEYDANPTQYSKQLAAREITITD